MTDTKFKIKKAAPKLTREQLYGEQLRELIKHIPCQTLEVNERGHIVVDKDKDPELYDWAVNG